MAKNLELRAVIDKVLASAPTPLHYQKITDTIIAEGLQNDLGAAPAATVMVEITESINCDGAQSRYVRVGRGVFALARMDRQPEASEHRVMEVAISPLPIPPSAELTESQSSTPVSSDTPPPSRLPAPPPTQKRRADQIAAMAGNVANAVRDGFRAVAKMIGISSRSLAYSAASGSILMAFVLWVALAPASQVHAVGTTLILVGLAAFGVFWLSFKLDARFRTGFKGNVLPIFGVFLGAAISFVLGIVLVCSR